MNTCKREKHLQEIFAYCETCKLNVCIECFSNNHNRHSIISFQEINIERNIETQLINDSLSQLLNDLINRKKEIDDHYNLMIRDKNVQEIENIRNIMKSIHDELEMKEFDLNRELKSHSDSNSETHTILISNVENQIDTTENLKSQFNELPEIINFDTIFSFKKLSNTLNDIVDKPKYTKNDSYFTYKFNGQSLDIFQGLINSTKTEYSMAINNRECEGVFYKIGGSILGIHKYKPVIETINIKTKLKTNNIVSDLLLSGKGLITNHYIGHSSQSIIVDSFIYCLKRNQILKFDVGLDPIPSYEIGIPQIHVPTNISPAYDGKKYIYFLSMKNPHSQISLTLERFDIDSERVDSTINNNVSSPYPNETFSLSVLFDDLYVVGSRKTFIKYNVKNFSQKAIDKELMAIWIKFSSFYSSCSIIDKKGKGLLYLLGTSIVRSQTLFIKYDIKKRRSTDLSTSPQFFSSPIFLKHDNRNTIYLISPDSKLFLQYNTKRDRWDDLELLQTNLIIYNQFVLT